MAAAWVLAFMLASAAAPRHVLVPILTYHTSSEEDPGEYAELYVRPSVFREQMLWLLVNGYSFCVFDDFPRLRHIEKPVLVTFDDGYPENFTDIFPIIQELGIKITIFIFNGTPLPAEWIRGMANSGLVFFESHGETHADMTTMGRSALFDEMARSVSWIHEVTGRAPVALSYPYGMHNAAVRRNARAHFRYGAGTAASRHNTASDPFSIRRHAVTRTMEMDEFTALMG